MLLKYIQTPERDDIELVDRIQLTALTGIEEPEMKKKKNRKKNQCVNRFNYTIDYDNFQNFMPNEGFNFNGWTTGTAMKAFFAAVFRPGKELSN